MLFLLNITIIVLLFIILITQIIFHHLRGETVEYGEFILENIIILIFVGIIKFLFFSCSNILDIKDIDEDRENNINIIILPLFLKNMRT
jgi:hypothetical protein